MRTAVAFSGVEPENATVFSGCKVMNTKQDGNEVPPISPEVAKKLASLEEVLISWKKEQDKAAKASEKRWRRYAFQLAGFVGVMVGFLWTCSEMGAWYYEQLQIAKMAERYFSVSRELYEKENNPDVALEMLSRAIELDDGSFEYRFQEAYIKGAGAVRVLLNLDRPFNREELDRAHQALADAKFLKELRPEREEGYILESQIYTALKDYEQAEKSIQRAMELNPANSFARVRYATLLFNRRRFDEALKVIDEAVAQDPNSHWVHLWRGLILNASRKKDEAIVEIQKAIELNPKFDTAIYNLGCCYLNSRPRKFAEARACFQKALEINPAYKEAYYQLGMSYGYQDRYDVALTYMDKAVALEPNYLTARNWRALILFEMKRFEEAVEEYGNAIMLDPRNDELYVRRAAASLECKQIEDAVRDLDFALELNPSNVEAVTILSKVYVETGNFDLALSKIDEALKSCSDRNMKSELYVLRANLHYKKKDYQQAIADQTSAIECYKSKYTLMRRALYCKAIAGKEQALADLAEIHQIDPAYALAWKEEALWLRDSDRDGALNALNRYLALRPQDKAMIELKQQLEATEKTQK